MRLGLALSTASTLLVLASIARAQSPLLYDNGPIVTHPGGGAGGLDASALDNTSTYHSPHNVYGFNGTGAYSLADDFTVCGAWQITDVEVFGYTTNVVPPNFTAVYAQVWDRDPRQPGATVIRGDLVTNLLTTPPGGTFNCYRTLIGTLTNTARHVQTMKVPVTWAPLPAGTYWFQLKFAGATFCPPVTENEVNDTGNGMQLQTATWVVLNNAIAPNVAGCGVPFRFYGTGGSPATASVFGTGKAGTNGVGGWDLGTPVRNPILGRDYPLKLINGVSGASPVVAVGTPFPAGLPLPPIGTIFVSPILTTFSMPAFNASNTSTARIPVPHGSFLCGAALGWQGFWADAGAAGGIGHSDGLALVLGN